MGRYANASDELFRLGGGASAPNLLLDHPHQRPNPRHHPFRLRPLAHVYRRNRRRRPRYCPSIEDKVNRFGDKDSHQIFIEPEGLTTHELYPNGISTSLPFDIQLALVRSIKGFENAHILRPGYAIEYDFLTRKTLNTALKPTPSTACSSQAKSTAPPVK